jgi:uncharacterized protein (PEP-CTERM system associated)
MAVAKRRRRRSSKKIRGDPELAVAHSMARLSSRPGSTSVFILVVAGTLLPVVAEAADWRITPRLNVRETYTDNLRLAPRGQEQSDWVTEIDPGVSISARGARLQLQADYAFQYRLYANNSDANGHNHSLTSNGLLDVWNRNLFVQASASIAQQDISPLGVQSDSNINLSGNRTEVRQANVSPYWVSRLGTWGNLQARYTWNQAQSKGATSALDSESQGVSLGISSGPAFHDLGWSASYSRQQIESSSGQFSKRDLESVSGSARYRLLPTLAVTGTIGTEHNSYGTVSGSSSGSYWNAGVDWAPSSRTRVAATFGERYYGKSYSLDASHRTRATTWTLGYSEQIVATPGIFSTPSSVSTAATLDRLFLSQFPNPIERQQIVQAFILQTGLPTSLTTSVDFLTNQVSLSKRLHGGFGYRGTRSNLFVNIFRDNRSSESTGATLLGTDPFSRSNRIVQTGGSALLSWRFSERTTGSISGSHSVSELTDTGQEDTTNIYRLGISHQLQPKVRAAVDLRRSDRDSTGSVATTRENAIVGTLSIAF